MDLFEYDEYQELPDGLDKSEFKFFLNQVWQKYQNDKPLNWRYENYENFELSKKQRFLKFEDTSIKARNFVGVIKYKDFSFNLYPKICKGKSKEEITSMLLLWLKYSNRHVIPNFEMSLSKCDSDFYEVLIFLFAKYTNDLFSNSIFQHYEEIIEETEFLKGKLNFKEYIQNIVTGKSHKFHCTYDSFEFNNKFNQIVKYVSKALLLVTQNTDNKRLINKILFILNDVDDVNCTTQDCEQVYINRFMEDFVTVLDYCKLFLNNCITFNSDGDFNTFAFLLRTETLFEEFISNLMVEKFQNSERKIRTQARRNLDIEGKFTIMPDILIEEDGNIKRIIDIKYKMIDNLKDISQADIYQCVTYAHKLHCNEITLLYPRYKNNQNINPIIVENITINFNFVNPEKQDLVLSDIEQTITQFQTTL